MLTLQGEDKCLENKMTKKVTTQTPPLPEQLHLAGSSGGARAILASCGVLLASELAGIKYKSTGGISGSAITLYVYAKTGSAVESLKMALALDFGKFLDTKRGNWFKVFLDLAKRRHLKGALDVARRALRIPDKPGEAMIKRSRPIKGVYNTSKFGQFIREMALNSEGVEEWPKGFWTSAVSEDSEVFFTEHGVYICGKDGILRILDRRTAPVSVAILASCAIPGVMDSQRYKGLDLYDGFLGKGGRCPIEVPLRIFGARHRDIVACDVSDDRSRMGLRIARFWRWMCGDNCIPDIDDDLPTFVRNGDPVIHVDMDILFFKTLEFDLTPDQKWKAVMEAFCQSVAVFTREGLLKGEKLKTATTIARRYTKEILTKELPEGELAKRVQALMSLHGLA